MGTNSGGGQGNRAKRLHLWICFVNEKCLQHDSEQRILLLVGGRKGKKFPAKCLTKTTTTSFSTVQMQCKPFSQPHSDVFNCKNPVQDTECTQKCDVNYAFDDGKTSRTTKCTENPDDPLDMVYDALTCSLQIYCDTPSLSDDYYLTSDCSKKKNGEKCKVACSSGTFTNQADQYEMVCTATDKGGSFD